MPNEKLTISFDAMHFLVLLFYQFPKLCDDIIAYECNIWLQSMRTSLAVDKKTIAII